MDSKQIRSEDYQYNLPQDRIAQFPLEHRDQSKLLVYLNGNITQSQFLELPGLLPPDSLVIWNNTKVIPARLAFNKPTGAAIEIFLLEPFETNNFSSIFSACGSCSWKAIIGNQKKWKSGPLIRIVNSSSGPVQLSAQYANKEGSEIFLSWKPEHLTFGEILDLFGKTPIPPYLRRDSVEMDKIRYQTVYANSEGSVAAPTAGLHFTESLIKGLKEKNIRFDSLTLHVGSGTFVPLKSERIGDHEMHAETVIIDLKTIRDLMVLSPDQLTVVGTTSMRSLESLYWLGQLMAKNPDMDPVHLSINQWEPYGYKQEQLITVKESLTRLVNYCESRNSNQIQFSTRLMIVPGYQFKICKRLITNFHQPSSTLLLLVAALVGPDWKKIYTYALTNDFRFLSYGDSSLLEQQIIQYA